MVSLAHDGDGEFGEEEADRFHHGIDVARGAGDGLGHHAAFEVEDAGGEVSGFAHGGGEGGADHHLGLLLDHGDEAVPHDLALDAGQGGVGGHARAPSRVSSM